MPLHTIKKVSELVPETTAMIKRASLEQNLPTGTKEEALISALELSYMMKIAHTHVDLEDAERVCRAVDLYGIADEVKEKATSMIKAASVQRNLKSEINSAVDFVESQLLSMSPDLEKIAEACQGLWDEYGEHIDNDQIKMYAGAGTLSKEAAVMALNHRAKRTGNEEFTKVAQVIVGTDVSKLTVEDNRSIIDAIKGLEKEAHYIESDLYTDMFLTKEAAVMVSLGRRTVPAESLVNIAEHAGDVLGRDIETLLKTAHSNKAAIEALPMGEKQVIVGLV